MSGVGWWVWGYEGDEFWVRMIRIHLDIGLENGQEWEFGQKEPNEKLGNEYLHKKNVIPAPPPPPLLPSSVSSSFETSTNPDYTAGNSS